MFVIGLIMKCIGLKFQGKNNGFATYNFKPISKRNKFCGQK